MGLATLKASHPLGQYHEETLKICIKRMIALVAVLLQSMWRSTSSMRTFDLLQSAADFLQ
ncbi:hypothetical protein SynWH8101_1314 [Synechococcus sp. WH 8101]|nr:hypothetical protein SynWH8101_1314 [Synechococcus sp. WH 8101]QNI45128.1 hypothetical protein SynRCC2555_01345 [Synechococcus sp. WH 8101]